MMFMRADAGVLRPRPAGEPPSSPEHDRLRDVLRQRGACFFRELAGSDDDESLEALWDLVWAGAVTNDSFAPLRALTARKRRSTAAGRRGKPNLGSLTVLGPPRAQGRWSLVDADLPRADTSPTERSMRLASVLLDRHGVLTRESVRGEGHAGGFAAVYPVLRALEESGRARRGYFVAGLGGAQFALAGAVDRLRARPDESEAGPTALVLAATDPANPYGVALPWPAKGPQRAAGAYVVLLDGVPSLYLERGGRGLVTLRAYDGSWEQAAVEGLGGLMADGRLRRLALERFDEDLTPVLRAAGFVPSPRGLVRYA
jgi:ATP-dependent Lhr-like helicase